ncbi:Hypothetical protein R9X50_00230200 [Acrodontium crateriforme]|uniref:Endopolyphosphatase n=1 Tax=Acrodontium crateriforme TaxID=150365 RepID=A0AAQ3RAU7_9PEZI|nr:Hypothetical protein R9X50_00230200 [Acrodontium crateriforme]
MYWTRGLCLAASTAAALAAPPSQQLLGHVRVQKPEKPRPLHGRFLHITDFHPDRFYEVYTSTAEGAACHRGHGPAGIYGAETSECDSPIELVNKTFEWIEKEFRDSIDFIVWTGDSARHDNDEDLPRNAEQVTGLNEFMVDKMYQAFGKRNGDGEDEDPNNDYVIPIIPNLGNNDILPHNVMTRGPNSWTRTYSRVWRQFIPEVQRHQFEQGGWFYVEAIPNRLAVFSLNTLYFFASNVAVDGCAATSEPGYRQMEWLRIQLQYMRERGMKAILTGHVPPVRSEAKTLWDETCWQKYTLWLRQYRDVIVANLYGHFNYDHFMLQDFNDIEKDTENGRMGDYQFSGNALDDNDDFTVADKASYFLDLRDGWAKLPEPPKSLIPTQHTEESEADDINTLRKSKKEKKREKKYLRKIGGEYAERFGAGFVTASVVPNFYPAFRVFEYNTTGLQQDYKSVAVQPQTEEDDLDFDSEQAAKKPKKYKFKVPKGPSKSAPPGPAYSPQVLSLLKYTQYFANITQINNDFPASDSEEQDDGKNMADSQKWKEGKHKDKKPHDRDHTPNPKKFKYDVHYETMDDDVYHLKDLTMPSLIDLARRIGRFVAEDSILNHKDVETGDDHSVSSDVDTEKKEEHETKIKGKKKHKHDKSNRPWYTFIERAFVETLSREDMEDQFGQ